MAVIGVLGVAVCLLSLPCVWALPDFLHIDCGAPAQYTDDWDITWRTDDAYVSTGAVGFSTDTTVWQELLNLRFFRNSRGKNCYTLPVTPKKTYMLRAEFCYGNYDGNGLPYPSFQMALDSTIVENVTIYRGASFNHIRELTFMATRNVTSLCLLRDQTNSTPFISSISLRAVPELPPYIMKRVSLNQSVSTMTRIYFNLTESVVVYPGDVYDRYWFGTQGDRTNPYPLSNVGMVKSTTPLEYNYVNRSVTIDTTNPGPTYVNSVAQNAIRGALTTSGNLTLPLNATSTFTAYLQYYFVELDENVAGTDRPYYIESPGANPYRNNVRNVTGSAFRLRITYHEDALIQPGSEILMYPDPTRTSLLKGPMISALEIFKVGIPWVPPTNDRDWNGIELVKTDMELTSWRGDPCRPVPHDWLTCNPSDTTSEASVIAIVLSGYNLTGAISPAFAGLLSVTSLKLDNNSLSGPIPDLRALKNLKSLHLQNNNLSGPLPGWLASLPLQELFVQNNILSGEFPGEFQTKNWIFNYSGNPGLVIESPSAKKSNTGVLIGGIVGGLLAITVITGLILFCWCRRRAPKDVGAPVPKDVQMANPGSSKPRPNGKPDVGTGAREYSLAEVLSATENYKKQIGRGGFGPVFYGRFPDGKEVAVKELDQTSRQGQSEFFNEVDILSRVHHKHLVALVGYCRAPEKQMLIYEYIHKGSLRDHLDGDSSKTGAEVLDWKTRLNIALQAAQGLEYLHTGCNPSLIHRDVKSNNILITSRYEAKVADFGLSKLVGEEDDTKVLTFVKGTAGYLDPEYYSTQYLSAKSDVYGFGVVLLELITGRLPIDRTIPNETNPNICEWVRSSLEQGNIDVILDPAVRSSRPNFDAVWKVAEIALRSVEPKGVHRPTMNEVVQELHGAMALEDKASSPNMGPPPQHNRMPSEYSDYSMSSHPGLDSYNFPSAR